jgi:hypothetical protein
MRTCEDLGEPLSLSCLAERNEQPTCTNNSPVPTTHLYQQPTCTNNPLVPTTHLYQQLTCTNNPPVTTTHVYQQPTCNNNPRVPTTHLYQQPTCTNNSQAHITILLHLYTLLQHVKCFTLPKKICQDRKYWFCVSFPVVSERKAAERRVHVQMFRLKMLHWNKTKCNGLKMSGFNYHPLPSSDGNTVIYVVSGTSSLGQWPFK